MQPTAMIYAGLLGLGLAASCGLNTFLPLLMLSGAAHFHLFGVHLNGYYGWLASDTSLIALGIGAAAEVMADKVPVVDHALDVFGTAARPLAGSLAAASVFKNSDPGTAALLGLIIGAPTAFGFHAAKAGARATSTATTFGLANPLLSTLEDVAAVALTLVSFLTPLLVPVFILAVLLVFWKLYKSVRHRLTNMPFKPSAT